ncbi:transposase [Patescibacteria group bacterium]|nr:transposase [Patescibacteria group bacterium]MBU1673798.1 transposase [Patescibacteria group bacterium]MBU1963825.1 transposase [Patescibacteria group bacterium]
MLKKYKSEYSDFINPKDWVCLKPRLVHVTTHLYRNRPFFENERLANFIKEKFVLLSKERNYNLINIACDYTHIHLIIKQKPMQNLKTTVGYLKGRTSWEARNRFPWLKGQKRFWAKGFHVKFHPDENLNKLNNYLKNQTREVEARKCPTP